MGRRLFVSVDLPDRLASEVAAVQDGFRDAGGLRFTDPGQAHVTVMFLGDTDPGKVDAVADALAAAVDDAGVGLFDATFEGLGVFPSPEYISVVWLGVGAGSEQLTRLHEAVEARTTDLGFDPADHEFTPHVTLARMDHAAGKDLVRRRVREDDPTVGTAHVEELRLTGSTTTDDGPEYTTVERIPLPG